MSDWMRRIRQLNELVQKDAQFGTQVIAALKADDKEKLVELAREKGIDMLSSDFIPPAARQGESRTLDDAELARIAGGVGVSDHADNYQLACLIFGDTPELAVWWRGIDAPAQ